METPLVQAPGQAAMSRGPNPATQALPSITGVEVQEKVRKLEALTAALGTEIEQNNKYKVFDHMGHDLLFAHENTDFCTRQMKSCCNDCAAWNVDIYFTQGGRKDLVYKLERPWTLTCCCFNRPVMTVTDVYSGQVIGKMRDPFHCCDLTFNMQDPDGNNVVAANGGCCQWGMCCPLPCGPCAEVNFPLSDVKSGADVGHIQKKVPSCLKFLIASDVDNYKIQFGEIQHPEWKLLVIALTIFIDFRYFNDNKNGNNLLDAAADMS